MWKCTPLQVISLEQHRKTTAANCSEQYAIAGNITARNFAERSSIACRYVFDNEYLGKRVYFDSTDIFIPHLPSLSLCHLLTKKKKGSHFPLTLSAGIIPPHRGSGKAECDRYFPVRSSSIHMLTKRAGMDLLVLLFGEFCCYFLDKSDKFWEEAKTSTVFVVSVSMYGLLNFRNQSAVCWIVPSYSIRGEYKRFEETRCPICSVKVDLNPDDGSGIFLCAAGICLQDHKWHNINDHTWLVITVRNVARYRPVVTLCTTWCNSLKLYFLRTPSIHVFRRILRTNIRYFLK